jgi:tetratricopeptide (TPR) repeat protein
MPSLAEAAALYHQGEVADAYTMLHLGGDDYGLEGTYYTALCAAKLGRKGEAVQGLEKVLAMEVNFFRLLQSKMLLSVLYTEEGRLEDGQALLEEILEEGMESSQVLAALGYILWARGNIGESIQKLNAAIKADPDNPTPINSLGYILADQGIMLERALELCKKAVNLNKGNANYLDSLGWTYYKLGQTKLAKYYLRQALELSEGEESIRDHLKTIENEKKGPG